MDSLSSEYFIIVCPSQGYLRGFDQTVNLIVDECHERVYSQSAGVEQVPLGLYIIRGDNVSGSPASHQQPQLL